MEKPPRYAGWFFHFKEFCCGSIYTTEEIRCYGEVFVMEWKEFLVCGN